MADQDTLPKGYTLDAPSLPQGYTLDAAPADARILDEATKKLYTTPEGIPVYEREAWKEPEGSPMVRGAKGLWRTTGGGLLDMLRMTGAGMTGHLPLPGTPAFDAISGLVMGHIEQAEKAKEAWNQGRYSEAFGHSAATLLPFLGPAAAGAAEKFGSEQTPQFDRYGNVVRQGQAPDIAGGVGETTGLLGLTGASPTIETYQNVEGAYQAGRAMGGLPPRPMIQRPRFIPRMPSLSRPLIRTTLNPVEQQAMDTLLARDIPVRAGVQTGNKFLKAAEGVVEHTPLGAQRAAEFRKGTEEGLQEFGQELMGEAHPEPQTPESAATATREDLDAKIEGFQDESDQGYEKAWQGRGNKQYTQKMPLGVAADGSIIEGDVNMPVDVRDLKDAAQPIHDELDMSLSRTEQAQSKAFNALEKLLAGNDYVPAWMAERALSALKSLARTSNKTGVRDYSQGVAAGLVPKLQAEIDSAVAKTGQDAIDGLKVGRAAHANMEDVKEVAEKLSAEPVQAFGQMTWAHDSGIGFLRRIAYDAPDALPKLGRAFVQMLFDKATREGGITRTKETLNRWRDLGEETKKLLFPDPALRAKLDGFFKGLDMVIERVNPSGTEVTRQATSINPLRWLAGYLGGKVLFTERGVSLLTEALRTPEGSAKANLIKQELSQIQGSGDYPPAVDVSGEYPVPAEKSQARQLLERVWREEEGSVPLTPEQRVEKDVKRRSMGDLDLRIPENVRTVSPDPTKTIEGKPFHDLPLDKEGEGFLPLRQGGPAKANFLVNKLWQEAIAESEAGGGTTAADAVKETGARPPDAEFWDKSFSLPQRARYWYELSGEGFTNKFMDLPREHQGPMIDAVAGTSGGVEPYSNLKRAIGIKAEQLQGQPVMTDLRDPASARKALNPEQGDLETLKYGSFSGTMQRTSGLTQKNPLTTNDVQVASMFGIPGQAFAHNPVLYEVFSRFFLKLRDAQNAAEPAGSQPWETWQMQAPSWVYERIRKNPAKAGEYDDYSQVFPRVIKELQDAGIPTPGGKVTMETLMDPRTPNVMSGTRQQFLNTPTAAVRVATTRTPAGAAAVDMMNMLQGFDPEMPWVRDAKDRYNQIQVNTMRDLAMRREGGSSLVSQLMSAVVGRKVDVSRLNWGGFGTFEGDVNPNLRIPLTGRESTGGWSVLDPGQRRAFLSVLGEALNQEAMAASHFKTTASGKGQTFSVFVERYDGKVDPDAIAQFSNAIGYPVNAVGHPNGTLIDVNIGGSDTSPQYQQIHDAARETFGYDPNVKDMHVLDRSYASDYIDKSEYRKAINEHRKKSSAAGAKKDQPRAGEGSGDTGGEPSDFERAWAAVKEIAGRRDQEFREWAASTKERIQRQLAFEERKRRKTTGQ